jgi:choline dehydrogenase-like flavoprotein
VTEQGQSLPSADVCVVGSGPAGLTAALELGAAGRTVVLLESGTFAPSTRVQELNEGVCEGEPYEGLRATRHRQVGGTPNIWDVEVGGKRGAKYVPLSARDMADWPIGRDDLDPYYREAQELCGLGPFDYGAERWAAEGRRPFDPAGTGLTSGVYHFGDAGRFTRVLPDRVRCMETVRLMPGATVVELLAEAGGRAVRGVRAVGPAGERHVVEARRIVLACGAVENARLLLLAGPGDGSGSRWVGRGFMEHARDFSLVLVPVSPGIFARSAFYDVHEPEEGIRVGGRLAVAEDALEALDLPNASMTLIPRSRSRRGLLERGLRWAHRSLTGGRSGRYGWSETPAPARAFDVFEIVLNLEHGPDAGNRVELGDRRDRHGNPLPRLVVRWTEEEQARLERLRARLQAWFADADLGRLQVTPGRRPDLSAHHHAGTTRMAAIPARGVVDSDGRAFGTENLYLAGASVFPSVGFANPTLTVVAMALRLARHLDATLG